MCLLLYNICSSFEGYPRHATGFSPLLWLSQEQGYSKSLRITFLKGAQIHMVCATRVCHWPGNCFGSWCLDPLTSTCTSLSGTSVFLFVLVIILVSLLPLLSPTFIHHLYQNFCSYYLILSRVFMFVSSGAVKAFNTPYEMLKLLKI